MNKNKKRFSITETPKEVLAKIAEIHGIGIIKEFINEYNKEQRKKSPKVNSYIDVAIKVYDLVMHSGYSITRAKETVADTEKISINTVRNHKKKFDDEAKENNFYTIGEVIEKLENAIVDKEVYGTYDSFSWYIELLAELNNLDRKTIDIYYYKYKQEKRKKNNKYTVDYSKIKLNDNIYSMINPSISSEQETNNTTDLSDIVETPDKSVDLDESDIPF